VTILDFIYSNVLFKCPALAQGQEWGWVKPVHGISPSRSPAAKQK